MFTTIEGIPEFMRKILTIEAQKYFLEVFLSAAKNYDEQTAFDYAWEATKLRMQKKGSVYVVHNHYYAPQEVEETEIEDEEDVFQFPMQAEETSIVMNSETEELIMDAVLADTNKNTDGKYFTEVELNSLAEQINAYGSTLPDVDHEKLIGLVKTYGRNQEAIMNSLKNEKGIFKSIKASVLKGKLWIQAILDKRYKNHIERFKALSIEAFADVEGDRFLNPQYLGFTFTNNPKLQAARIAA